MAERMSKIEIGQGSSHIEASVIAQGLALEPSRVQAMMRKGEITSLCERGVNEDAGRYRLTFFHKSRRFRLASMRPEPSSSGRPSTSAILRPAWPLAASARQFSAQCYTRGAHRSECYGA